jgi:hypothetical protein
MRSPAPLGRFNSTKRTSIFSFMIDASCLPIGKFTSALAPAPTTNSVRFLNILPPVDARSVNSLGRPADFHMPNRFSEEGKRG